MTTLEITLENNVGDLQAGRVEFTKTELIVTLADGRRSGCRFTGTLAS
jgi:hypothetical protein